MYQPSQQQTQGWAPHFGGAPPQQQIPIPVLPAWTSIVRFDKQSKSYYLEATKDYEIPAKIYGDTVKLANRYLIAYEMRPAVTGVMLAGEPGTGKTLMAKMLSVMARQRGYPTVIVNEPFHGDEFNLFIQRIQPCVVIFDEFEKIYGRFGAHQSKLLTLFDGLYPSKKMMIITCNDERDVDARFINRPGRILFRRVYAGLEEAFIREYCEDNLEDDSQIDSIIRASSLIRAFTFDMIQALVEDMNRFKCDAKESLDHLNISPGEDTEYAISINYKGEEIPTASVTTQTLVGNPMTREDIMVSFYVDKQYQMFRLDQTKEIVRGDRDGKVYLYDDGADLKVRFTRVSKAPVNLYDMINDQ